jgi:hypothetical protein
MGWHYPLRKIPKRKDVQTIPGFFGTGRIKVTVSGSIVK